MKQNHLKQMFGTTPESFQRRIALALAKTEEPPIKRKIAARTVWIAAAILVLLMAVAYAAFSSQVAAFFGRQYGKDTQAWLEKGDVAAPNQSFVLDGAVFTLEEVVYRNNGLYGVGMIRPQEGSGTVLMVEDYTPEVPYGYDLYGAGGKSETAPEDAPTYADVARETSSKLMRPHTLPEQVGVDGGALLPVGTVGYVLIPQRDGSVRFAFELSDAYAVEEGGVYAIQMRTSMCEISMDGEMLEDTRHIETWTVEIRPTPIAEEKEEELAQSAPAEPFALAAPEIIVPESYLQTGTAPIYRAAERDFGEGLMPELFNRTGIASRNDGNITFADEAILSWAPEALFYNEYSGVFDANANAVSADTNEALEPSYGPCPALSDRITSLAAWASRGWPESDEVYSLEQQNLTHITLDEAKETLEALLQGLGVTGYVYDGALDMSVERINVLGNDMNRMIDSGAFHTNLPKCDFSQATAEDEGFYLWYRKAGMSQEHGSGNLFSVYAYVTSRGVVNAAIRDMYTWGEVYSTPETLVDPQTVLDSLPEAVAQSRFPSEVKSISSVQLSYAPMRAADKADGVVLSPIWLVLYQDEDAEQSGYQCWAEFDAVDGKVLNAMFK